MEIPDRFYLSGIFVFKIIELKTSILLIIRNYHELINRVRAMF